MITAALQDLAPSAELAEHAYAARFRAIAELVLGRSALSIAGAPYRFIEIELYVRGFQHADPFTHGDPLQQEMGRWYFHRSGRTYRGGTYKGLDIAFGAGGAYAGILIRGLESPAGELVDGPCLVVDHILARTESPSIEALLARFDGAIEGRSPLHVVPADHAVVLHATPRVGLTLKKDTSAVRRRYLARPYRFLVEPVRIKKGKPHLVTALHREGRAPAEIAELTATRRSLVDAYIAAYEAGRTAAIETLTGDLSPTDMCRLLGACAE